MPTQNEILERLEAARWVAHELQLALHHAHDHVAAGQVSGAQFDRIMELLREGTGQLLQDLTWGR